MKCIYFIDNNNSYYILLRIAAKNLIGCYHYPMSNPVNNGSLCSKKTFNNTSIINHLGIKIINLFSRSVS